MSTRNMGRPGGSTELPGRATPGDAALDFAFFLVWSLLPGLLLGGLATAAWFLLPRWGAIASLVVVGLALTVTARRQWFWFRGVHLRRVLPAKLRQVGVLNRAGQTPAVQRVRWEGNVVRIRFAVGAGHTLDLFASRRAELAAVLNAVDVDLSRLKRSVEVTAVRRSAHDGDQAQPW